MDIVLFLGLVLLIIMVGKIIEVQDEMKTDQDLLEAYLIEECNKEIRRLEEEIEILKGKNMYSYKELEDVEFKVKEVYIEELE